MSIVEPTADASQNANVNHISVKIPQFWKSDPTLWFDRIEAQFRISRIVADQTKFDYVVASFESEVLSQVCDIIKQPPEANKYDTLKKRVIAVYAESQNQQTRKLLTELDLGDLKPSQLLNKMRNLAGDNIKDDFLKNLWLQRLPADFQTVLTASDVAVNDLAAMADRMWELRPTPSVNAIKHTSSSEISEIKAQINALTEQIAQLNSRSRNTFRRRQNSRPRSRSSSAHASKFCYFHKRFKGQARKCTPPCTFNNSHNQSNSFESSN